VKRREKSMRNLIVRFTMSHFVRHLAVHVVRALSDTAVHPWHRCCYHAEHHEPFLTAAIFSYVVDMTPEPSIGMLFVNLI